MQTPTPTIPDIPPIPPIPPLPESFFPPWYASQPPAVIVLIALASIAAVAFVTYPLLRALARRLEGRPALDAATLAELDGLRDRLGEMDQLQHRVAELEERLDFTERLLAQQREAARLQAGER